MNLNASNGDLYNNPDSFAMAFDTAWNDYDLEINKEIAIEDKIQIIFEKIKNHPFLMENPVRSRQIALFRIKLLGLI